MESKCKLCGTAIRLVRGSRSGALLVFDAKPSKDGQYAFIGDFAFIPDDHPCGEMIDLPLHEAHTLTCPERKKEKAK